MTKLFFDTNVLLDLLLDRPGGPVAGEILRVYPSKWDRCYVSFLSIADAAYCLRKKYAADEIREILTGIMKVFNILPNSDIQISKAFHNLSPDFEDTLQIMCAEVNCCDIILTNNVKHFKGYTLLPVMTPEEFLTRFNSM